MTTALASAETLPVTTATRMDVLDVLRGVAILGILVYNAIGFGLYARFSLATLPAICAAFFVAQTVASTMWLRVAWCGPAEWVWRQFTYGRRFALLR
jgi:uncharacterized membrane protein YeiB